MDLTRTRRAILHAKTQKFINKEESDIYTNANRLLDVLDVVQEDAQESLEDLMRVHQQYISASDVGPFVDRSVEYLFKQIMEISDTETLLRKLIDHDKGGFEATMNKLRKEIDEEKAERERWVYIGEELGDLDDHPF